jgi:hypothetical protein
MQRSEFTISSSSSVMDNSSDVLFSSVLSSYWPMLSYKYYLDISVGTSCLI